MTIQDLHLHFVLPGYESIELVPNGSCTQVTIENLQDYIDLVCKGTLIQNPQVYEFREGLNSIISADTLVGYSPEELEEVICGSSYKVWDIETLRNYVKPAHGYSEN